MMTTTALTLICIRVSASHLVHAFVLICCNLHLLQIEYLIYQPHSMLCCLVQVQHDITTNYIHYIYLLCIWWRVRDMDTDSTLTTVRFKSWPIQDYQTYQQSNHIRVENTNRPLRSGRLLCPNAYRLESCQNAWWDPVCSIRNRLGVTCLSGKGLSRCLCG